MATKKEIQWVSVNPTYISFDSLGMTVEGVLIDKDTINLNSRDVIRYTLEVEGIKSSFLATAQLERLLHDQELGTLLRITYNGTRKGGAFGEYKDFTVEYAS